VSLTPAGVVVTGDKLLPVWKVQGAAPGVNDTRDKFFAGYNNTGNSSSPV
jgi:hypothetical protein